MCQNNSEKNKEDTLDTMALVFVPEHDFVGQFKPRLLRFHGFSCTNKSASAHQGSTTSFCDLPFWAAQNGGLQSVPWRGDTLVSKGKDWSPLTSPVSSPLFVGNHSGSMCLKQTQWFCMDRNTQPALFSHKELQDYEANTPQYIPMVCCSNANKATDLQTA